MNITQMGNYPGSSTPWCYCIGMCYKGQKIWRVIFNGKTSKEEEKQRPPVLASVTLISGVCQGGGTVCGDAQDIVSVQGSIQVDIHVYHKHSTLSIFVINFTFLLFIPWMKVQRKGMHWITIIYLYLVKRKRKRWQYECSHGYGSSYGSLSCWIVVLLKYCQRNTVHRIASPQPINL